MRPRSRCACAKWRAHVSAFAKQPSATYAQMQLRCNAASPVADLDGAVHNLRDTFLPCDETTVQLSNRGDDQWRSSASETHRGPCKSVEHRYVPFQVPRPTTGIASPLFSRAVGVFLTMLMALRMLMTDALMLSKFVSQ